MNEIEEKFYKTFGIKKKTIKRKGTADGCKRGTEEYSCQYYLDGFSCKEANCAYLGRVKKYYPPITDRILLELICILRNYYMLIFWRKDKSRCLDICADEYTKVLFRTGGYLKYIILDACICMKERDKYNKEFKHQVQSLFTEGEE